MTWSLLVLTAYENVMDAPYINSIDLDKQLSYTNLRYMVGLSLTLTYILIYQRRVLHIK